MAAPRCAIGLVIGSKLSRLGGNGKIIKETRFLGRARSGVAFLYGCATLRDR
ncbi:MAG: hypothetical protein GDA56_15295 [Hormoscilla sp. GM7CHS1pb]|nr:hypothetical protein [Hormoscilla sp. GM7CHS1pb]